MARPRARTESPVSFGRTAPVVTDRINQLQIAVSNHKARAVPPAGGAPLVLPKSTRNRGTKSEHAHSWWSLDDDPHLHWRHLDTWRTVDGVPPPPAMSDENTPFDPFCFVAAPPQTDIVVVAETTGEDSIDQKIDAYLKKAAIYEERRQTQNLGKVSGNRGASDEGAQLSKPSTTESQLNRKSKPILLSPSFRDKGRRYPLSSTERQQQHQPHRQGISSLRTDNHKKEVPSKDENSGKTPPRSRRRGTGSPQRQQASTVQCSLSSSSAKETREGKTRLSPSICIRGSPLTSCLSPSRSARGRSVSFDLVKAEADILRIRKERGQQYHQIYERIASGTQEQEPLSISPKEDADKVSEVKAVKKPSEEEAREENDDDDEIPDIFELLVKSSSSSHGATEWFEHLLHETNESKAAMAKVMEVRLEVEQKYKSEGTGCDKMKMPTEKAIREIGEPQFLPPSLPPIISKPKDQKTQEVSFTLETVESAGSSEADTVPMPTKVSSERKATYSGQTSPNWKSQGRSRTDHLLNSLGLDGAKDKDRGPRERRNPSASRRDPEARRSTYSQKEPEGILGNQLTASSSEESHLSPKSRSSGTTGEGRDAPTSTFDQISITEYYVSPRQGGAPVRNKVSYTNQTSSPPKKSLIDTEVSESLSSSTKSSQWTEPTPISASGETNSNSFLAETKLFVPDTLPLSQRVNKRLGSRPNTADDDSSVFSNLPSGSVALSLQPQDFSGMSCVSSLMSPTRLTSTASGSNKADHGEDCTLFSVLGSDVAIIHGQRASPSKTTRTSSDSKEEAAILASDEISILQELDRCGNLTVPTPNNMEDSSSEKDDLNSPMQLREFWKSLASLKTLGSFDSDSVLKESSGRRIQREPQPFIDRNPDTEEDKVLAQRSPTMDMNRSSSNSKSKREPQHCLNQTLFSPDGACLSERVRPTTPNGSLPEIPRRSDARYLSNAAIPQMTPQRATLSQRLHQSNVWMNPLTDSRSPVATTDVTQETTQAAAAKGMEDAQREIPKPVEESVMYIMGPLMSGDTEEDVTTAITDDFTRQGDDNGSDGVQTTCLSCGAFSGWGWFSS